MDGEMEANECSAARSSDSDDNTAFTGKQLTEGQNKLSIGVVSGLTTESHSVCPEAPPPPPGNYAQKEPEVNKGEDRKPSAISGSKNDPTTKSSFSQLVKSWETYISDAQNVDTFQPMQMLQNLRLCGTGHELPRLTLAPSTDFTNTADGQDPFEPIILRHTHSTPLQYRPSFFNDCEASGLPPPSALSPTRRSSSTPSRGSAFQQFNSRSAFGAHLHSASNISSVGGRSAFGFPLHRSTTESSIRNSAFNPVPFSLSTTLEEPQQEETTAIEVMDLGRDEDATEAPQTELVEEQGEVEVQIEAPKAEPVEEQGEVEVQIDAEDNDFDQAKPKKSAAARAAQFLSDVGVLRRKKKGARSSIMTVISTDAAGNSEKKDDAHTAEGMLTEENFQHNNEVVDCEKMEDFAHSSSMYHQLDSDVDEEFDRYQSIENSAQDSEDSPRTIPSPDYHPMEDDRMAAKVDGRRPAVRIQVSSHMSALPQIAERVDYPNITTSPNPDMLLDDMQPDTPTSSTNSPGGATRSSATTNTSGHTTQATSTTSTTGNASGQSQISETDREVMETIKEGKRRRRQESNPGTDKADCDVTVNIDSSSSSSTTNGYVALSGSPGPLRDGANVMADRFFTNSRSPPPHGGYPSCSNSVSAMGGVTGPTPHAWTSARPRSLSLYRKSNSNSSPTSCSLNSIDETPPIFVSYLDRQAASDLTSLRAGTEASTCRGDVEEREDSPAEIVGFPAAMLNGAETANDGQENAMSVLPKLVLPSTEHLYSMLDKFRSRPPRSPSKGLRTMTPTTPPPLLGSPAYQRHQLSPPRKIVDHRIDSNVSRPYVLRSNPATQRLVVVSPGSYARPTTPLVCIPVGNSNYSRPLNTWAEQPSSPYENSLTSRTYEEHSIEILKTDSKDEMICQR